jgi:PhnB protein
LNFEGNCEEAFNFYKSVFGGDFRFLGRYKDVPPADRKKFALEADDQIMHVSLPISPETMLMGCDVINVEEQPFVAGNNFSLSIGTDSREEADRIFLGLSAGGQIKMPMAETFWGAYFGVLTDKFEITWTISFDSTGN